jgi:(S)-mandelate dehydrogenase
VTQGRRVLGRTVGDVREQARKRIPNGLFEFIDRGSEDELAVANNLKAFDRVKLRPRVLVDVSERDTATTLFGHPVSMPLAIAPTGSAGLVWFEGQLAIARAAASAGVPFTLATRSLTSIEAIAESAGGDLWFQLYPSTPSARSLMQRAWKCGFEILVVTVDTPVSPLRHYNLENGFSLPFTPSVRALRDMLGHPRWLVGVLGRYLLRGGMPRFENLPGSPKVTRGAPTSEMLVGDFDWDDLQRLRERWPGRLVVKGMLHVRDAIRAVECGADGVIVSNHGGRNLDSSVSPLDVLRDIVEEIAGRATVLMDGGIRRGSDIVKVVALGASAGMVGRATLYGAAISGEDGAAHVLRILKEELSYTLAMTGSPTIADLGSEVLMP